MKQIITSFFDTTYLNTTLQLNISEEENFEKVKQVAHEATVSAGVKRVGTSSALQIMQGKLNINV